MKLLLVSKNLKHKQYKMVFFLLQLLTASLIWLVATNEVQFTILHNNDLHARFDEISASLGICSEDLKKAKQCFGGFARTAHMQVLFYVF